MGGGTEREKQGGGKKWFLELGGSRDNELTATPGANLEELHPEVSLGLLVAGLLRSCLLDKLTLDLALKFCLNLRKDEALVRFYTGGFYNGKCQFPSSRVFQTSKMTEKGGWGS